MFNPKVIVVKGLYVYRLEVPESDVVGLYPSRADSKNKLSPVTKTRADEIPVFSNSTEGMLYPNLKLAKFR